MKLLPLTLMLTLSPSLAAAVVDGMAIHYSTLGKGPRTVILVHGWTCDETTWSEQMPVLAEKYRAISMDLPGHGKSGAPKDEKLSMDLFAKAVEAMRAEVHADRVVLVGHSMGTPVIVQYARLYPQHVSALVFVDGLVTLGDGQRRNMNGDFLSGPDGRKNREAMVGGTASAATTPALQTKIREMMLAPPQSTAVGAMNAMVDPAIWTGGVLNMPILGLYADKSRLGDRAYMKEHFPHMEYHEIPGSSHFLMMEKPEQFNPLLLEFLARQKF